MSPSIPEPYTSVLQMLSLPTFIIHDTPTPSTPPLPSPPQTSVQLTSLLPFPSPYSCHPSSTPVVNNSNELGPVEELALPPNETSFTLPNLKYSTRYKFYLNAKTVVGAGPAISQEAITIMDEGKSADD